MRAIALKGLKPDSARPPGGLDETINRLANSFGTITDALLLPASPCMATRGTFNDETDDQSIDCFVNGRPSTFMGIPVLVNPLVPPDQAYLIGTGADRKLMVSRPNLLNELGEHRLDHLLASIRVNE